MADFNSSLPVRTEADGDVVAGLSDTSNVQINPATEDKQDTIITGLGNIETNQTDKSQFTRITDGTDDLAVNADGSINVVVAELVSGTEKHVYATAAAGVPNTPVDVIDYTVTALKTFKLKQFGVSGSGKLKAELRVGPAASEVTKWTVFTSTSSATHEIEFARAIEVAAGDKILVTVTNRDVANQDLYAFISGDEV